MEVAGLAIGAVGLLPVAVEVIRGYRKIRATLIDACACTRELKTVEVDLVIQEGRFLIECELLLDLARDGNEEDDNFHVMIEDPDHLLWTNPGLDGRLQHCLQSSRDLYQNIMSSISKTQQDIRHGLACFELIRAERQRDESLRVAFRRLRQSLKISLDKAWYEQKLDRLRRNNEDLEALGSQLSRLHQIQRHRADSVTQADPIPQSLAEKRIVCQEAYVAIQSTISCHNQLHVDHVAALYVDADISCQTKEAMLNMALAYTYQDHGHSKDEGIVEFSLQPQMAHPREDPTDSHLQIPFRNLKKEEYTQSDSRPPHEHEAAAYKRSVRFADVDHRSPNIFKTISTATASVSQEFVSQAIQQIPNQRLGVNLSTINNSCEYLISRYGPESPARSNEDREYLLSPKFCQYMFYLAARELSSPDSSWCLEASRSWTLENLIQTSAENFPLDYQLKLALKAVTAVLQLHSTPWLPEVWMISDLFILDTAKLLDEPRFFFKTRLSIDKSVDIGDSMASHANEFIEKPEAQYPFTLSDCYGINNMTLFSLGIALLEISHWKPIKDLRLGHEPDDILTARRLARQVTVLGREYQDIVQKCLQCNFGQGTDLGTKELQTAVYKNVLCPLEKLVHSLGFRGI